MGKIKAISISDRKGMRKKNIKSSTLIVDFGLKNDAHGGKWHRQVSFLAQESIDFMRNKGLDVVAGNFAENITTEGIDLTTLEVGDHLHVGGCKLIISQLGKICHTRCAIYHQAGDCVMPREGIFGVVLSGGEINVGDSIVKTAERSTSAAIVVEKNIEKAITDQLSGKVQAAFKPAFVRVDIISEKTDSNLSAILKDLTTTQKINDIVVFDPKGSLGLSLFSAIPATSKTHMIRNITELDHL